MLRVSLLSLLLLAAVPLPARAGFLTLDFDLTGSSVSLLGGIVQVPPHGTVTAGSARVTVRANDATSPRLGVATVDLLSLALTIDRTLLGVAAITGDAAGALVAPALGAYSPGLSLLAFNGAPVQVDWNGDVQCTGSGCAAIATFPVTIATVLSFLGNVGLGGLGTSGAGALSGTLPFSLGGFTGVLQLAGAETARTFLVPEPASSGLVASGLLALALAARTALRRRAR